MRGGGAQHARHLEHGVERLAHARHHRAHVDIGRDDATPARRAAGDVKPLEFTHLRRLALLAHDVALRTTPSRYARHRAPVARLAALARPDAAGSFDLMLWEL